MKRLTKILILVIISVQFYLETDAQISRAFEIKVTDDGLYFDGEQRKEDLNIDNPGFEYYFGRRITPHGDCIKKYGDFLFLTWYKGGEENKNVMLSRLHIPTQTLETVQFDHTHVGFRHQYTHIGDSHNTIAVGICPLDGTVHLLYDMHSYNENDYPNSFFNYQVSNKNAATIAVGSFTREVFNSRQTYLNELYNYSDITYPNFFLNTEDELFVWFREGGNTNGAYKFAKYDGNSWGAFTQFSKLNAKNSGSDYNWGLYGDMKYINGKLRVGFLKRMNYSNDKYVYNNGFHYAYCDDQSGRVEWYNHAGERFGLPLIEPEKIFFYEPGDEVTQGGANSVYISTGADFTVTDQEAVHFITNNVKSNVDGSTKDVHAYKKAGDTEFTISTDFPGGTLYAVDGNQVYLISLNNNRPEIYRAEGGTNNWEKLYTETEGISMLHSNTLIQDGKMFVYAMENGHSGDARPIYIQMYDLSMEPIDTTRTVEFGNINNGQVIDRGSNLTIEANVGSAFTEVALWCGDVNLGTLTEAPFSWSSHEILTNMCEREYQFYLKAKDSDGVVKTVSANIYTPLVIELSNASSLHIDFEDVAVDHWETDGNDFGVTPSIVDESSARSGSKVMALHYNEGSSGHHIQNIADNIVVPEGSYFHVIMYSATDNVSYGSSHPTVKLGDWKPSPTFTLHANAMEFERKYFSKQNTIGDSLNCFPRLRSKANGGACSIYYDDIVLYADVNSDTDLTSPSPATDLYLNENTVSWVNGTDDLTGIQATYILRNIRAEASAPNFLPQVAYGTGSVNFVDEWEVIAVVSNELSSYTDTDVDGTSQYRYAIVHRDLAYNYSEPTVVGDGEVDVNEQNRSRIECIGGRGKISIFGLNTDHQILVYSISGMKMYAESCAEQNLTVDIPKGIYIVKVGNVIQKVSVQ